MTICDNEHDEIIYGMRSCPLCEALKEIEDLKNEIQTMLENEKDS